MIFYFIGLIFGILSTEALSSAVVLKATMGKLFEVNSSMIDNSGGSANLPKWLCNTSRGYQGIPSKVDVDVTQVNERLTISVSPHTTFNLSTRCSHRWPTIMVILSDSKLSKIPSCKKLKLWNRIQKYFPSNIKNLRLEENIPVLMRSLSILAQWNSDVKEKNNQINLAIISDIGCGSIPESLIDNLKYLEREDHIKHLSHVLSISIRGWLVADQFDQVIVRKWRHKRNSYVKLSEYSSVFYRHENRQRQEMNDATVIVEGSAQYEDNWPSATIENPKVIPKVNNVNISQSTTTKIEIKSQTEPPEIVRGSKPVLQTKLENIAVFIGSQKTYQIPSQTFFDNDDGYNPNLEMRIFLRSKETKTDHQIYSNTSKWIYFLPKQQIIGLQPLKGDFGQYDLTGCAYDSDKNRICDGIKVFIKKPVSLTKRSDMEASPGVVWTHRMPSDWADSIKHTINDSVIIKVQSASLIEWRPNISTISLITEASIPYEHQIKIVAESEMTGKTFIWWLFVTTLGLNTYLNATSPQIVLTLSSLSLERISFDFLNYLKDKLILTISRYWKILSSSARDVLLYKIITNKEAFLSTMKDGTVILSFVYSPKKSHIDSSFSSNCSELIIPDKLVENFKRSLRGISKLWLLESIDLLDTPGICKHSLKIQVNSQRISTTPSTAGPNNSDRNISDLLNKTINLAVKNGFTFKKIIMFSHQPEIKLIQSMQLLDRDNLVVDESSWVFLSSSPFAIYGLPLPENVRQQPYMFRLKVVLQSGGIQLVDVNILVEKFVPNFNHKFGLVISISEKDILELDRTRLRLDTYPLKTIGQLLVSETLSYRWKVVQNLAGYLFADQCSSDCGTNIFVHSFSEPKTWQINISWSIVFDPPGSPEYPTIYSVASCSDAKLKSYIRSLVLSDLNTESILSMFPSSIPTFRAHPHQTLVKSFQSQYIGTPTWVNVESSGPCSTSIEKLETDSSGVVLWSNIVVLQGNIFAVELVTKQNLMSDDIKNVQSSRLYYKNGTICELEWVKLTHNGRIIYGLPLLSDVAIQSYFSLRILLEFGSAREKLNYYISISLEHSRHNARDSHIVNISVALKQNTADYSNDLDFNILLARALNGYMHPSCSLGNRNGFYKGFKSFSKNPQRRQFLQFCEKAEDVVIHSIRKRNIGKKKLFDILWSRESVWPQGRGGETKCDTSALHDLSRSLFENNATQRTNKELIRYFDNADIGKVVKVQLHLSDQCTEAVEKQNIKIPLAQVPTDLYSNKAATTSQASTKIILGVLCFLTILIIFICIFIYFMKKGLPSSFTQLMDKSSKSVPLEDFKSGNQSPLKSPISSFKKRPKINTNIHSSGPSLSNNSPKTPLLSQFSREDSKIDKQKEPSFKDENATGSYSYAVCHPQTPEPDVASNNSMGISKQPATSNVIRNPAMMMGSRLNPYRNIPPPIK